MFYESDFTEHALAALLRAAAFTGWRTHGATPESLIFSSLLHICRAGIPGVWRRHAFFIPVFWFGRRAVCGCH